MLRSSMTVVRHVVIAAGLSGFLVFTGLAPAITSGAALAGDLSAKMKLFEGEFDNYAQAWEEKEQKAENPHEHIHSIFARVKLPAFGENVFYVKQYAIPIHGWRPGENLPHAALQLCGERERRRGRVTHLRLEVVG